jgi:hypothetical protein
LAQLANSLLWANQVTELEERLAKLERAVEENSVPLQPKRMKWQTT